MTNQLIKSLQKKYNFQIFKTVGTFSQTLQKCWQTQLTLLNNQTVLNSSKFKMLSHFNQPSQIVLHIF